MGSVRYVSIFRFDHGNQQPVHCNKQTRDLLVHIITAAMFMCAVAGLFIYNEDIVHIFLHTTNCYIGPY